MRLEQASFRTYLLIKGWEECPLPLSGLKRLRPSPGVRAESCLVVPWKDRVRFYPLGHPGSAPGGGG